MIRTSFITALILGCPLVAYSQEALFQNCAYTTSREAFCEITNIGNEAFQKVAYRAVANEDGRTFPWGETSGQIVVAGGIEPNETVMISLNAPTIPSRADMTKIRLDVSGRSIDVRSSGLSASNAYTILQQCWNVGALSSDALNAVIKVAFRVGEDGRVIAASVELKEGTGSSEAGITQSFEAARRAIIRCGAQGGSLPPGPVIIRFDNATMQISS